MRYTYKQLIEKLRSLDVATAKKDVLVGRHLETINRIERLLCSGDSDAFFKDAIEKMLPELKDLLDESGCCSKYNYLKAVKLILRQYAIFLDFSVNRVSTDLKWYLEYGILSNT